MATNTVTDEGSGRKYWTQVPNIVFDLGFRPFPLALYGQLKRITGADGQCDETTRQLADRLGCSPMAISKALAELAITRPELGGKALIRVAKVADGKGARKPRNIIALVDVWPENMARYGGQPVNTVDGTVNNMYGAVNTVDGGRKHSVHPKEPRKNEEPKNIAAPNDDAAISADLAPPTDPLAQVVAAVPMDMTPKQVAAPQAGPNGAGKATQADIRAMVEAMAEARGYPTANFSRHTRAAKRLIQLGYTPRDVTRTVVYIRRECAHLNGQPVTMETVSKYVGIASPLRALPVEGAAEYVPEWMVA